MKKQMGRLFHLTCLWQDIKFHLLALITGKDDI